MSAKKGTIIPNAPRGRKRGSLNRKTAQSREIAQLIIEGNVDKVQGWIDRVARRNPAKAADIFLRFFEFVQPKLVRSELRLTNPAASEPLVAVDAHEAASIYQQMIGGDLDASTPVTWPAPAPRETAPREMAPRETAPREALPLATPPEPDIAPAPTVPASVWTDPTIVAVIDADGMLDAQLRHHRKPQVPAPTPAEAEWPEGYDRAADEAADKMLRHVRPPRVPT